MKQALRAALAALVLAQAARVSSQVQPDAEVVFERGVQHLREGRLENALEHFDRAIKQDSKNAYFHKARGLAHSQLADRCAPTDAKCRQSHLQSAVADAKRALELNPYYTDARNDLGTALILSGRRPEGKKELMTAYEDPTNPTREISARNLGQAFFEEKDYAQALQWFQTSAQLNRVYGDAHMGMADSLVAMGRVDDAIRGLEVGVKEMPDHPGVLLVLGQAYYRAQRFSEARTRLEQVASKDPAGESGRRALELLRNFPR